MADNVFAKTLESFDKLIKFGETLDAARLAAPADLKTVALRALYTADQEAVGNARAGWRTVALGIPSRRPISTLVSPST